MPKSRILVIDDEAAIRDSLRMTLEYEGYEFVGAATGQEGLALVERETFDLVLLDVKMPGMDGLDVLGRLHAMNETLPVVMISAHGTPSTAVDAIRRGALDFLEKPFESTERLRVTIQNALEQARLRDENRSLKKAVEVRHQMIGESRALKQVMAAVGRAAPTNATVLIQGESGVGKELVARAIHRNSLRSRERFVQVNCAAIPEDLIESELFGHEKGSFTGATEKQVGQVRAGRPRDDLPRRSRRHERRRRRPRCCASCRRAKSSGSDRRAPSRWTSRVIAATNRNLEEEIEQGPFPRGSLFPARRDPDPGPAAARAARGRSAAGPPLHGLLQPREQRPAEEDLAGGARCAAALSLEGQHPRAAEHRRTADHHDRRRHDRRGRSARRGAVAIGVKRIGRVVFRECRESTKAGTLREFKDDAERAYLVAKLRENGWNISKTAEVIDTPRSNLYKKLEQYQITQETDG